MALINLNGFGYAQVETVTGAKTLDAADSGVVQNVTATATVTLPATAVGYSFIIRVGAPDITVSVSPAAADQIIGNGFTAADNKDLVLTNQEVGAFVRLFGDGASGYYVAEVSGVATREA